MDSEKKKKKSWPWWVPFAVISAVSIFATVLWAISAGNRIHLLNVPYFPDQVLCEGDEYRIIQTRILLTVFNGDLHIDERIIIPSSFGFRSFSGGRRRLQKSFHFLSIIVLLLIVALAFLPSSIRRFRPSAE